eukprot:gene11-148_t
MVRARNARFRESINTGNAADLFRMARLEYAGGRQDNYSDLMEPTDRAAELVKKFTRGYCEPEERDPALVEVERKLKAENDAYIDGGCGLSPPPPPFREEEIRTMLGGGVDGLDPRLFRALAESGEAVRRVTLLCNAILSTGRYPDRWRTACVRPVPKKQQGEFRPISLLCQLDKSIQLAMLERLQTGLQGKINLAQDGFQRNRGTLNTLWRATDIARRCRAAKKHCYLLSVDFSRAFDVYSRERTIARLREMGADPWLLRYVRAFLSERRSYVEVRDFFRTVLSEEVLSEHGVVQGSPAGPTCFLAYVNPLLEQLTGMLPPECVFMYADDLYVLVAADNKGEAERALRRCVSHVEEWGRANELPLNSAKTKLLSIYGGMPESLAHLGVEALEVLGVTVTTGWRFEAHVRKVSAELSRRTGAIAALNSSKWGASLHSARCLYLAVLEGSVRYAAPVYCFGAQQGAIEGLQTRMNKATRAAIGAPRKMPLELLRYLSRTMTLREIAERDGAIFLDKALRVRSSGLATYCEGVAQHSASICWHFLQKLEHINRRGVRQPLVPAGELWQCTRNMGRVDFESGSVESDQEADEFLARSGCRFSLWTDGAVADSTAFGVCETTSGAAYVLCEHGAGRHRSKSEGFSERGGVAAAGRERCGSEPAGGGPSAAGSLRVRRLRQGGAHAGVYQHAYGAEQEAVCIGIEAALEHLGSLPDGDVGGDICVVTDCLSLLQA